MPELIVCPACGCGVQVSELQLGKRVRCIACSHPFVAHPGPPPAPPVAADQYPLQKDDGGPPSPAPRRSFERGLAHHQLPLCPGCHRPVPWEAPSCPHCGHLFDHGGAGPVGAPGVGGMRRDGEEHRGRLIDILGSTCLIAGVLSGCLAPVTLPLALGAGTAAWVMANHDLAKMDQGTVDPDGRVVTMNGRIKAMFGLAIAAVLSPVWAVFLLPQLI